MCITPNGSCRGVQLGQSDLRPFLFLGYGPGPSPLPCAVILCGCCTAELSEAFLSSHPPQNNPGTSLRQNAGGPFATPLHPSRSRTATAARPDPLVPTTLPTACSLHPLRFGLAGPGEQRFPALQQSPEHKARGPDYHSLLPQQGEVNHVLGLLRRQPFLHSTGATSHNT